MLVPNGRVRKLEPVPLPAENLIHVGSQVIFPHVRQPEQARRWVVNGHPELQDALPRLFDLEPGASRQRVQKRFQGRAIEPGEVVHVGAGDHAREQVRAPAELDDLFIMPKLLVNQGTHALTQPCAEGKSPRVCPRTATLCPA
jgi:hypothetical protein